MTLSAFTALNWVDYFIIAIIVISTLISLMRGFVKEAISLLTWVIAFFVAFKFSGLLADLFSNYINNPSARLIIGFAVLFISVLILGALLNYLISEFMTKTGLSGTDRLLGCVFGALRGVLLIGVLLLLVNMTTLVHNPVWQKSVLTPHFQGLAHWLQSFLPEKFNHLHNLH